MLQVESIILRHHQISTPWDHWNHFWTHDPRISYPPILSPDPTLIRPHKASPRFPTSPLRDFSNDPPPWPMTWVGMDAINTRHRAPAHRKAVLEWNLLDPKESGQRWIHASKPFSRIGSAKIKVVSERPEYHLNLNLRLMLTTVDYYS